MSETIEPTSPNADDENLAPGVPRHTSASVAMEMVSGALVGAVAGSIAGPPGIVAGVLLGSVIGGAAGLAAERSQDDARRNDDELDRVIGVTEGHIGEAREDAPPVRIGAFSAAAMGASTGSHETPSEGTMQNLDD